MKKSISAFVCMLLVFVVIPATDSENVEAKGNGDFFKVFFKCYVELKYYGDFSPEEAYNIQGIGLRFYTDTDAEITVYSEENGEVLWHNIGLYRLRMLFFTGSVKTTEEAKTTFGQAVLLRALSI
jgi:hypothetical protein